MDHRVWEALHCSKLREAWLGQSKLYPSPPQIPCVIITISEYSFFTITWHVYCYTFFGCLSRWGTTTSGTSFGLRCKIEWITVRPCSLTNIPPLSLVPRPWFDFASDWDWSFFSKCNFRDSLMPACTPHPLTCPRRFLLLNYTNVPLWTRDSYVLQQHNAQNLQCGKWIPIKWPPGDKSLPKPLWTHTERSHGQEFQALQKGSRTRR